MNIVLRVLVACVAICGAVAVWTARASTAGSYDPAQLPPGPVGASIAYGHDIITNTPKYMQPFVRAGMSCSACHLAGGTQARGGSFVGVYARFPQWNERAHRVIMLQDRIAECFLYSMNGKAPAYSSKEMIGIVSYIAWLSRDVPVGSPQPQSDRFVVPLPSSTPDAEQGRAIYSASCASCHGANGAGIANVFPPLWGETSFNNGAGMAHIDRMAGFVHYNMPQNAPGSLSLAQSYAVAAFVLSQPRPKFSPDASEVSPALPASYF